MNAVNSTREKFGLGKFCEKLGAKREEIWAIPVDVIREECEWFGALISSVEGEKRFARREPGNMSILEGDDLEILAGIEAKNVPVDQAKTVLN